MKFPNMIPLKFLSSIWSLKELPSSAMQHNNAGGYTYVWGEKVKDRTNCVPTNTYFIYLSCLILPKKVGSTFLDILKSTKYRVSHMDAMYYYYLRLQDFLQPRRRRFILSLQKCKRGKMMFASIHHFSRKLNSLLCIHTTILLSLWMAWPPWRLV